MNELELQNRVTQNHYTSINPCHIPNQLRPMAYKLAKEGKPAYSLLTATQIILANTRAQQPQQVFFGDKNYQFNAQGALRFKQY